MWARRWHKRMCAVLTAYFVACALSSAVAYLSCGDEVCAGGFITPFREVHLFVLRSCTFCALRCDDFGNDT